MNDRSGNNVSGQTAEMPLFEVLAVKRMSLGLSQYHFGKRVGVSTTCVSQWERGVRKPKAELVPDLAAVLRVDPEYLARLIVQSQR